MSQLSQLQQNSDSKNHAAAAPLNIIGPFTQAEWNVMLGTKRSIAYMKKTDRAFYAEAIDMETANLREEFRGRVA